VKYHMGLPLDKFELNAFGRVLDDLFVALMFKGCLHGTALCRTLCVMNKRMFTTSEHLLRAR